MRRAGEVVSKTELLDHVWDASVETAPNAVEVYVGYLRRKIGRDRLETVRGAGYRLADVEPACARLVAAAAACGPGCMVVGVAGLSVGLARRRRACWSACSASRCSAPSTPRRCETADGGGRAGRRRTRCPTRAGRPAATYGCRWSTPQGRVRAASIDADRLVPILYAGRAAPRPAGRAAVHRRRPARAGRAGAGGRGRRRPADDPVRCWWRRSMADVTQQRRTLLRDHAADRLPAAGARCSALVAWRVVGATLRPVEALRAGAEDITGGARPGRLPVPASRDEIHRLAVTLNGMLAPAGGGPGAGSGRSSPTPRTSCAARWPTCAPSWRWRSGSATGRLAGGRRRPARRRASG